MMNLGLGHDAEHLYLSENNISVDLYCAFLDCKLRSDDESRMDDSIFYLTQLCT